MAVKHIELSAESARKLESLAEARGVSESEIVEEALDRIVTQRERVRAQLRRAGLLSEPPDRWPGEKPLSREQAAALEAELREKIAALGHPLGLSQAVIDDREGS